MLVAARDLPTGAVLTAGDVTTQEHDDATVPDGTLDADAVQGAVLAAPVRRGEVLTDARTTTGPLLAGQPAGTVATGVEVGDPALLQSLAPGARVDVLARTQDPVSGASTGPNGSLSGSWCCGSPRRRPPAGSSGRPRRRVPRRCCSPSTPRRRRGWPRRPGAPW